MLIFAVKKQMACFRNEIATRQACLWFLSLVEPRSWTTGAVPLRQ